MAKKTGAVSGKPSQYAKANIASAPTFFQTIGKSVSKIAESATGKSQANKVLEGAEGKRENTRSALSIYFVIGYFLSIFVVLWISFNKNFEVSGYKDMLLAVSGVLSGPLGFIIGYYFKSENTK